MKLVMYHYVKKEKKEYPFLNSLSFRKFQNQIKFFEKNGGISDNINYQHSKKDSFILTFDDGLKDHLMVAEYLNKRGLKGFFFISCYPLIYKKILPVHQMHIILSKINLDIVHKKFFGLCTSFNEKNIYKFLKNKENNKYYKPLDDDNKKKEIKKIFNYYLSRNQRLKLLKSLNKYFDINVDSQNYYLNKNEIKYMKNLGMEIGSHGINHEPLNKLSYFEQKKKLFILSYI